MLPSNKNPISARIVIRSAPKEEPSRSNPGRKRQRVRASLLTQERPSLRIAGDTFAAQCRRRTLTGATSVCLLREEPRSASTQSSRLQHLRDYNTRRSARRIRSYLNIRNGLIRFRRLAIAKAQHWTPDRAAERTARAVTKPLVHFALFFQSSSRRWFDCVLATSATPQPLAWNRRRPNSNSHGALSVNRQRKTIRKTRL